jgi:uncharacterized membrane protein
LQFSVFDLANPAVRVVIGLSIRGCGATSAFHDDAIASGDETLWGVRVGVRELGEQRPETAR